MCAARKVKHMKPSQVLIETANNIAVKMNDPDMIVFGCLEIQRTLGVKALSTHFDSIEMDYYKQFGNPAHDPENDTIWFGSHHSDDFEYINYKDLCEMRILAMCFASYIAFLEGN